MFTAEERDCLRAGLLENAAKDERITGAAVTGSAADSHEDQWSDIDLAFGVSVAANLSAVLSDWTAQMYGTHLALHHVDVLSGAWTYRVFLLPNTLQVDLAFVVETEFRALAPTFRLVFGRANEPCHSLRPQAGAIIGMAWLYALHARSCIARRRLWQAEYMISGVRDYALALACIRYGLSGGHGRGIDLLPSAVTEQFLDSFVRRLDADELSRAFRVVVQGLVKEIRSADEKLGVRLQEVLTMLSETSS
ncbi:MAG: hypothetical protein WBW33_32645 [Bryobacteraceae bacterium]